MLFETGSFTQPPVRMNFYEDEFRMMLASIHDRVSTIDNKTLDALEELLQMSELADETLKPGGIGKTTSLRCRPASLYDRFGCGTGDLLDLKQYEDDRNELIMLEEREMQMKAEYSLVRKLLENKKPNFLIYHHLERSPKSIIETFSSREKSLEHTKYPIKRKDKVS